MHYAEFAEDEVRLQYFTRPDAESNGRLVYCTARSDSRVRSKQVEGHRPESWKARQGTQALLFLLPLELRAD